ncbi:hypothetical protein [Wohlfahrtiimonas chitiniclastica]|uniref:hypothetical protein n=1 Tax=Wohlfahrtiimonas chitiniclastica TaxID=400946 RepID=UPI001BD10DFB|nr:hypothetical protein [Wohlfahrtiimonas chitiniclastica]MBS7838554.1 hypothetical protein [Wohlfahrtiimonas chitiniclastica]
MIENIFKYENIDVKYLFKSATSDKEHLVVIFTGFAEKYSFANVGQSFKCAVLWIKDDYEGMECYYLGKNSKLDFADAVNWLILSILQKYSLNKDQCTFLGGSKGGFSSLFIGLKYQYKNIVSSAPTSRIGDRMKRLRPAIANFVIGTENIDQGIESYNYLLEDLLKEELNFDKNIYLFVSEDDVCYKEHQLPLFPFLKKYNNFNLVKVDSDLVYQHNRVTTYSLPLIISFINSLIEQIVPKFGYKEIGRKKLTHVEEREYKFINELENCIFEADQLFLSGIAFFRNLPVSTYGVYKRELLLRNEVEHKKYTLGTVIDKKFSTKLFEDYFIDYSAAGFAIPKKKGINLIELADGVHEVYISASTKNIPCHEDSLRINKDIDVKHIYKSYEYRVWNKGNKVFLTKRSLFDIPNLEEKINIDQLRVDNKKIYISGSYLVSGVEIKNWGDAYYYIVFSNKTNILSYKLGLENKNELNEKINSGYGIYQKSCFASIHHKGIDLQSISIGIYNIDIILSYKGSIYKKRLAEKLIVENDLIKIV